MADEINIQYPSGATLSAIASNEDRTQRWNGTAMVAKSTITRANWATGSISLTELLTSDSHGTGDYTGSIPAGILTSTLAIDIFLAADIAAYAAGGTAPYPVGYQEWPAIISYLNGTKAIAAASFTNLIAGTITLVSPLATTGELSITVGASYKLADGRHITFSDLGTTWPVLTGGTVTMEIRRGHKNLSLETTITGVVSDVRACYFELTTAQTVALEPGHYYYRIVATLANANIVVLGGDACDIAY